uniref:Uncharacterized protein n=1 Tax=Sarcoptes scabiei TaxID=52283 RepID=A0A834R8N4_SARSC
MADENPVLWMVLCQLVLMPSRAQFQIQSSKLTYSLNDNYLQNDCIHQGLALIHFGLYSYIRIYCDGGGGDGGGDGGGGNGGGTSTELM